MSRKHKKKRIYTISITTDNSCDRTKYYRSRFNIFRVCVIIPFLAVIIAAGIVYLSDREMTTMEEQVATLSEIVSKQEETILELSVESLILPLPSALIFSKAQKAKLPAYSVSPC